MYKFVYDDGGRFAAGYKGTCGDCGTRAAAIALQLPYKEVYDELNSIRKELLSKAKSKSDIKKFSGSVRDGTATDVMHEFMKRHGWRWVPTMRIGSGCTQHLGDMPNTGSYVCRVAKHYCAVVNGKLRDTFDSGSDRCVYGYWVRTAVAVKSVCSSARWYITTVTPEGDIVAWVGEGTTFVPVNSALKLPKAFLSGRDAMVELMSNPELKGCKDVQVREAHISVRWSV